MTKRFHRLLIYPLAASVPAVGMLIATGTGAGASTGHEAGASGGSPSAQAAALARDAIRHLMIGQHATSENAGEARQVNGTTDVQSNNWSGWADTGSSVNKVSATWKEPSGSCGLDVISMAAFWVGIDGLNSSSVEQDGTLIECYLGTEYQYTWWEMYPANSVQTVGSAVASGDTITASVTRSGTKYALRVSDSTHPANSFSTAQTCSSGCSNNSAEWVAEAPSGTFGVYPLTNFGTWKVSGAAATEGSKSGTISSFSDDKITMTGTLGNAKATPSGLASGGSGFSVAWKSSE
jgi:Peptidase A4 family